MNASARMSPELILNAEKNAGLSAEALEERANEQEEKSPEGRVLSRSKNKTRIHVSMENRLLRAAFLRMLAKQTEFEAAAEESDFMGKSRLREAGRSETEVEILVLGSGGQILEDLSRIHQVRAAAPHVRILLIGANQGDKEFLRYVRAGISGYLPHQSCAGDVLAGVRSVRDGKAVCPGSQCAVLFRYFEKEAEVFPSAALQRDLGLTRREQQLIPLVARGLTNKEIANYFCLSEQTVKNHLYRMKQKIGGGGRLGIVHACQQQGYLL